MNHLLAAAALSLAVALAGCGDKSADPTPTNTTPKYHMVDTTPGKKDITVTFTGAVSPSIYMTASVVPTYEQQPTVYLPSTALPNNTYERTVTSVQGTPGYVTINMAATNAPDAKLPTGISLTADVKVNGQLLKTIVLDSNTPSNATSPHGFGRVEVSEQVQVF